jgi:hypothetical protein
MRINFGDSGGLGTFAAAEVVENGEAAFRDWRRALHVTDAGMVVDDEARRQEVDEDRTPLRAVLGRCDGIVGVGVAVVSPGRRGRGR